MALTWWPAGMLEHQCMALAHTLCWLPGETALFRNCCIWKAGTSVGKALGSGCDPISVVASFPAAWSLASVLLSVKPSTHLTRLWGFFKGVTYTLAAPIKVCVCFKDTMVSRVSWDSRICLQICKCIFTWGKTYFPLFIKNLYKNIFFPIYKNLFSHIYIISLLYVGKEVETIIPRTPCR